MFKFFNKNNKKLADKMFKKNEKQLMDELGEILYISGVHPMDITDDELIDIQKSLNKAIENHTIKKIKKVQKTKELLNKVKSFFVKFKPTKKSVVKNKTICKYEQFDDQNTSYPTVAYSKCIESKDKKKYDEVDENYLKEFINDNLDEYFAFVESLPKYKKENISKYKLLQQFLIKYLNKKMIKQLPEIMTAIYYLTDCKWVKYNDKSTKECLNNIVKIVYDYFEPKYIALAIQRMEWKDFIVLIDFRMGFKYDGKIYSIPLMINGTALDTFTIAIDTRVMNEMYEQTDEENNE